MLNIVLLSIIGLVVLILLWLFFRDIRLWYWKVNDLVDNQNSIISLLSQIKKGRKYNKFNVKKI